MNRAILVYFAVLVLGGCGATNPIKEYDDTLKSQESRAANSIAVAIDRVRANEIVKGSAFAFTLSNSDPVIKLNDLSYYKVFAFKHNGNQSCRVTVKSFVKGMKPWYSILPIVIIVSPSKKVNTNSPQSLVGKIPNFGPYRLTGEWVDKCDEKGEYRVLVTADTRALNKPIDQQSWGLYLSNTGSTVNFQYTFLGHFTGDLELQVD